MYFTWAICASLLHWRIWGQTQLTGFFGWSIFLVSAAITYDWLALISARRTYPLTATVFATALFSDLAWPYALLLAPVLRLGRTMALDLFA